MAELFVQPKKPSRWWLWLLLVLIIAGVGYYFAKGRNQLSTMNTNTTTDSTTRVTDTTAIVADTATAR